VSPLHRAWDRVWGVTQQVWDRVLGVPPPSGVGQGVGCHPSGVGHCGCWVSPIHQAWDRVWDVTHQVWDTSCWV